MNNVSKLHPKPSTFDIIAQLAEAIRPGWKKPTADYQSADPTPADLKTTAEALGRTALREALALHLYARATVNHGEIDEHTPEYTAAWALLYVTEGRLNCQPADSLADLAARLEYMADAEGNDVWPDSAKVPCLELCRWDVVHLSSDRSDTVERIERDINAWYLDGEPRRHGWHENAEDDQ